MCLEDEVLSCDFIRAKKRCGPLRLLEGTDGCVPELADLFQLSGFVWF